MAIEIDSSFPGGNIVVEGIDGNEVRVHQDLRDTASDWFYWCFRVRGAEGRTLRFTFTRSRALGVRGPAVSRDEGVTWRWLGSEAVNNGTFSYAFPEDKAWVRFSFAMPYQESHWRRFMKGLSNNVAVSTRTLCTTAKGRAVEYALLGCRNPEPRHRVAVTCRHHCCEMMASYVLEGLLQWVLTGNEAEAQWFREEVAMMVVPFVDKDGVEDGDQGKNRRPRDHARDYEGTSLYAATAAIRGLLPEWGGAGCAWASTCTAHGSQATTMKSFIWRVCRISGAPTNRTAFPRFSNPSTRAGCHFTRRTSCLLAKHGTPPTTTPPGGHFLNGSSLSSPAKPSAFRSRYPMRTLAESRSTRRLRVCSERTWAWPWRRTCGHCQRLGTTTGSRRRGRTRVPPVAFAKKNPDY